MTKHILVFIFVGLSTVLFNSCEKYLDKAPESGLTEEEVFTNYLNFKQFFDSVYDGQFYTYVSISQTYNWYNFNIKLAIYMYFIQWGQKYTWESLTDLSDVGRLEFAQPIKSGNIASDTYKFIWSGAHRPIFKAMWIVIRTCNVALEKIHMLKNVDEEIINDFKAQAHFIRAFAHMELLRVFGGMPYITKSIGSEDPWDYVRLSRHETLLKIAADCDTAVYFFEKAGKMRRDPGPGHVGHLSDPLQARPNGVTAKAFKSRALLWAASPWNNKNGNTDWENAAKASWEAIQTAEQYEYDLLPASQYKDNYIGTTYTNEQLWGWYAGTFAYNSGARGSLVNGVFANSTGGYSGENPTQNCVDKFETKWGDPLNTEEDRAAAIALGHYHEQDPYANRDPRFYHDIIYNTAPLTGYGEARIYYEMTPNGVVWGQLVNPAYIAITKTGYYNRKRWGEESTLNRIRPMYTDPIIRLAELYLNYAEAANEAYGPNTPAPNATMTALQAINKIRNRVEMPDVLPRYTTDKDLFRERIKNERTVELCFENFYFYDIRRWMDAPKVMANAPLIAMDIEKVPVSEEYPTGFKYTRVPMPANRQSQWKDAMYTFPFLPEDEYKMKLFEPNPQW